MKTNLLERFGACVIVGAFIAYWIPIVLAILDYLEVLAIIMLVLYLICIVLLERYVMKDRPLMPRILFILLAETIQLVPYGLVLVVRGLFV